MPSLILVTGETAVKKGQPPGAASGSYETYMLTGNDMKKELRLWKGPPLCSCDLHCLHCMDGGRGEALEEIGMDKLLHNYRKRPTLDLRSAFPQPAKTQLSAVKFKSCRIHVGFSGK